MDNEEIERYARTDRINEEYVNFVKSKVNKGIEAKERDLIDSFQSGPLLDLYTDMMMEGKTLSLKEALQVDLSDYLLLDLLWRYHNHSDAAINIMGDARIGKSNDLIHLMLNWCRISGSMFRLSNIVYNRVTYNFLLKGLKVKEIPNTDDIELETYEFQKGDAIGLDEGADTANMGNLMMSTIMQNKDIEGRMAAQQVLRAVAGVGSVLHSSHFDIFALKRVPLEKRCVGLIVKQPKVGFDMCYLGAVSIPYVPESVFNAYDKPKMKSIGDYGRSSDTRRLAKIKKYLIKKLWNDIEFQSLPLSPPDSRVNYIQEKEEFALFPTAQWYEGLVKMSKNEKLYAELTGDEKILEKILKREEIIRRIEGIKKEQGDLNLENVLGKKVKGNKIDMDAKIKKVDKLGYTDKDNEL